MSNSPVPSSSLGKDMAAASKFYMDYSRWIDDENRYEVWEESVARIMSMHREKYRHKLTPELEEYIAFAEEYYRNKTVLGAQRALQFGGPQIFKHEGRLYNCSSSHVDRVRFFQEAMYLLLCGCGVGFSVQKHHVAHLPKLAPRQKHSKLFVIPDSIEGWSDAFGVLLSSFFTGDVPFPEYQGYHVAFDFSQIRPKGAYISGGFKAPGPEPLQRALEKCEKLLTSTVQVTDTIRPIVAYDFVMHMADAVLSGGVRRAATICLFSKDDAEMMAAKTGDWYNTNPQRGRSNNSVVLVRNETSYEEWLTIKESVRQWGEPGFIWTDSTEFAYNPCVEIGMWPKTEDGRSGFQMCNLTEINGSQCDNRERFLDACKAAAILGTLQAGYTNFTYLGEATREIVEREALLGVSITGWMNNPDVLFDETNMKDGAELVKATNRKVAALLGINPAARTTCVKPSGNASVLLGTASGIHGEHAPRYFRNVQMNEQSEVCRLLQQVNPDMVEDSLWNANGTDKIVSFPIVAPKNSIYKRDLMGVKQLEYVKKAQQYWVEYGTNEELCTDKRIRHNVSNTIDVDDWDEVFDYIYENRAYFAGISLNSDRGDKAYVQSPFIGVPTAEDLLERYGDAAFLASGLIVDGLHAFNGNLWRACDTVLDMGDKLSPYGSHDLLKRDWVRRAVKFALNYFVPAGETVEEDPVTGYHGMTYLQALLTMTACLKDVHNFHKWKGIERSIVPIEFASELSEKKFTEVDTMGAQACAGGACEVSF